jgi:mannose-6-phosphate isomerase-like protein (cupin superfamily)
MHQAAVPPMILGAIDELRSSIPQLVGHIVERIRAEVPEAATIDERDLRGNVEQLLHRSFAGVAEQRPPAPEELAAARETGRRRALAGEDLVALLRSHRIGFREGWLAFQAIAARRQINVETQLRFSEWLWGWADPVIDAAMRGHREVELEGSAAGGAGEGQAPQPLDVVRLEQRESFITADGSAIRELAGIPAGNARNQSLAEATVPPGGETAEHFHRRAEEIYTFTAGAGRLRLGSEETAVRAGDTVVISPGVPHKLWNPGPDPLVLLCCCAPPYSHEDTVLLEGIQPA